MRQYAIIIEPPTFDTADIKCFALFLNSHISCSNFCVYYFQRNISYDCLVGLDDSKPARAYTINLATAFGLDITYNCTVYGKNIFIAPL